MLVASMPITPICRFVPSELGSRTEGRNRCCYALRRPTRQTSHRSRAE
jgi:hypothetical protein